jgi:membrane protein YqaA with SNARE-associated domain
MNWALGRYIVHFQNRRWFPVKPDMLKRAEGYYHKYGKWSLLLSWVPIIGDPLTIVAGVLREKLSIFILFVAIAKTGRYLAIAGLIKGWM